MLTFSAAGALVQGTVGIGVTLVAGPALVAIDPSFVPGPLLLAGMAIGLRNAAAEFDALDRRALRHCVYGIPVGLVAGLTVVQLASARLTALLVGTATVLASVALLAGVRLRPSRRREVIGGAVTAFSAITAGLPGPPLAITFSEMRAPAMRATIGAVVPMIAVSGLIGLIGTGNMGRHEAELTAWLAPGVVSGLVATRWVRPHIDRAWFRPAVLVVALAGGAALVIRQLV